MKFSNRLLSEYAIHNKMILMLAMTMMTICFDKSIKNQVYPVFD